MGTGRFVCGALLQVQAAAMMAANRGAIAMWRNWLSGLVAVLVVSTTPASAQTQEQFDRLNTVARYGMTVAWCDMLGMKLVSDWEANIDAGMTAEALSWGLSPETAKRAIGDAVTRQSRITRIDNNTLVEKSTKTEAGLRSVRSLFMKYGGVCLEAARDPLFSRIITVPPNFDLDTAATEAADGLLKDGGYASWQTPAIQARGDLMMAAGTCRAHIGAARSDAIFQKYSHASDPRAREYYVHSFDEGLSDKSFNFDAAQCERLIKRLTAKAEASK